MARKAAGVGPSCVRSHQPLECGQVSQQVDGPPGEPMRSQLIRDHNVAFLCGISRMLFAACTTGVVI